MEKISTNILSFIFEKNLLISIYSLISAIFSLLLIPSDWSIIKKIDIGLFLLLLFLIWFVVIKTTITVISFIGTIVKKYYLHQRYIKENQRYKERELRENLEALWTFVDGCSNKEYRLLMDFIKNNNTPIIKEYAYNSKESILTSNLVHKTLYKAGKTHTEFSKPTNANAVGRQIQVYSQPKYKYILKENVYQLLKYSWENYGRISHFVEENDH